MPSAGHCPASDGLLLWGCKPLICYLLAAPCLSACQLPLTLRPQAEGLLSKSRKLWARRRTCGTE